ncbi:MAG: YggT family protein [Candidatus Brennerbacteria bacterium]|nr:YggT family protein [Candidatus Brennerbacteria bacterium]
MSQSTAFPKQPVVKFIRYVLGFFELLLGLRILLRLLAANPLTPIVDFLYTVTDIIVFPFQGIFSNVQLRGGGIFDVVAITAMVGYPIIVYLLIEILHIIVKDKKREVEDIEV